MVFFLCIDQSPGDGHDKKRISPEKSTRVKVYLASISMHHDPSKPMDMKTIEKTIANTLQ